MEQTVASEGNINSYYSGNREEMAKYILKGTKRRLDVDCGAGNFGAKCQYLRAGLIIFVVGMIVLFALYSNLRIIYEVIGGSYYMSQPAAKSRARDFEALKQMLPQSGVVGYVSDQHPSGGQAAWDYYQAEYVLCPLVVVRGARAPYVIANCARPADNRCFVDSEFVLVRELDSGIRLYQQRK